MDFNLFTYTGVKYQGQAAEVSLKTAAGQVGILPHHEPLVTIAAAGPVIVTGADGKRSVYATFGGVLEVTSDKVTLLADEAEPADELVESEIRTALDQARKLKAGASDEHELARASEMVTRQAVRLEVAGLRRHHTPRDRRSDIDSR